MTPVTERSAVRALIVTPERQTLLMQIRSPNTGQAFWILPGGGLEPGESDAEGLRRELREELGLADFAPGPLLHLRQHTFNWRDKRYRQRERIYAVHAERFTPRMSDEVEQEVLVAFAWRDIAGLAAETAPLTPRALAKIAADYLEGGAPTGPLVTEILED